MRRIFLIGYMGAGKTTLGAPLAEDLNLSFIDLDKFIEQRYHKTVNELFDKYGESAFREIERKVLHEVATFEDVIISTGGGTPCFYDNMKFMQERGLTIYLEVETAILFQRLKLGKHTRPKLKNKTDEELLEVIENGLVLRLKHYLQSDIHFKADTLHSVAEIAQTTAELVKHIRQKKADSI